MVLGVALFQRSVDVDGGDLLVAYCVEGGESGDSCGDTGVDKERASRRDIPGSP